VTLRAVLFDLDGTLLDTAPDFETAINRLLTEENREHLGRRDIELMVSNGSASLVSQAFNIDTAHGSFASLRDRLLAHYMDVITERTRYYPGIAESLELIRSLGLGFGIVTNKPEIFTRKILKSLNIRPDVYVCPDQVKSPKPDPEGVLLACRRLDCDPRQTLFVGDHNRDIMAGRAAAARTAAAAYGYVPAGDDPMTWNADYLLHRADELPPLLRDLTQVF